MSPIWQEKGFSAKYFSYKRTLTKTDDTFITVPHHSKLQLGHIAPPVWWGNMSIIIRNNEETPTYIIFSKQYCSLWFYGLIKNDLVVMTWKRHLNSTVSWLRSGFTLMTALVKLFLRLEASQTHTVAVGGLSNTGTGCIINSQIWCIRLHSNQRVW